MSSSGPHDAREPHDAAGAYALGLLEPAEAAAFEEHLPTCADCAAQVEELAGLGPVLADLAGPAGGFAAPTAEGPPTPTPGLLDRLTREVTAVRRRARHRRLALAAVAAVLVVGGPLAVAAALRSEDAAPVPAAAPSPKGLDEQLRATDPRSHVRATLGLQAKGWGTRAVLELANVKGPLSCSLVAVGRDGGEETVTTWAVPVSGYGGAAAASGSGSRAASGAAPAPLRVEGGAAYPPTAIARFEVRTEDGTRLVTLTAP